jgi:hypothetical protein
VRRSRGGRQAERGAIPSVSGEWPVMTQARWRRPLLGQLGDEAPKMMRQRIQIADKSGDRTSADAWRLIFKAMALIEIARLKRMLDEPSEE